LIFHVCGFFCVLIPLLVLSKKAPSSVVWTEFFDGGWGSTGVSTLVGILFGVIPLLGADAAGEKVPHAGTISVQLTVSSVAHMAEELEDAAYTLPRTMIYSTLANGAMGLIMVVSYCYCIGDFLKGNVPSAGTTKRVERADFLDSI
jgi:choline transport protein